MGIKSKFTEQLVVGASKPIKIEDTTDIKISYACIVTGTVTYSVQHSLDGINFIDNTDVLNATTTRDGNYIFPVQSIRVNITAGAGSVKMHVRQLVV